MRRIFLLAVLTMLPGCRNVVTDWSWDDPFGVFGQQLNDAAYRATGESDRARAYRKQEEVTTEEPWNR
jgi:hypothetical protein